jgi:hypothetical protein
MKLDPGMHIGMHLVSFGTSGVPVPQVGNSSGEGIASKVEGIHLTGAHADAGKSVVICCVESGRCRLHEDRTENSLD